MTDGEKEMEKKFCFHFNFYGKINGENILIKVKKHFHLTGIKRRMNGNVLY